MKDLLKRLSLVCLLPVVLADLAALLTAKGIRFVAPGARDYVNATTAYNLRFTIQPAIVAFPTTPSQVSDIIRIGSSLNHNVVARSGGHSYIANGLGGKNGAVVVDLQEFNNIAVDEGSKIARVETGNRLGDIALTLNTFGRAIPHGTCPYVGIGGHAAYGGYGFTSRMWGLTLDNVVSIELVLANGTITTTSAHENSDLFWAMRGAGGSFGIATTIAFKTHPIPSSGIVFTYSWVLDVMSAVKALEAFQKFLQSDIPSELGPMLYFLPGAARGHVLFGLTGGWYGNPQRLNATLSPFLDVMPPPGTTIRQGGSFIESLEFMGAGFRTDLNTSTGPDTHDTFYQKSIMTPKDKTIAPKAWEAFMSYLANQGNATTLIWAVEIEVYGGTDSAVNSVPLDDMAFAHRGSLFTFQLYASSATREPPYPQEGYDFIEGMAQSIISNNPPDWNYGAYPNYLDDRLVDWRQRYYGPHYRKLQAIKRAADPSNVFNFPTSIEPS